MRRICITLILLAILSGPYSGPVYAKSLTSKELIEEANALDGSIVTYKGEVITAIMNRGEHSWVNLNDGYNAIGIWCKSASLKDVGTIGDYKNEGDVLEITGVFHRACPVHSGELDIHADSVRIEAMGFPVEERVSSQRINVAIAFFILTLLAIFMLRKRL